jgi:hypothetical protein
MDFGVLKRFSRNKYADLSDILADPKSDEMDWCNSLVHGPSFSRFLVRMVNFLHNHYANDKVMREKIERKVKAFAKNKGIDARGAKGIEIYVFQLCTSLFNMM